MRKNIWLFIIANVLLCGFACAQINLANPSQVKGVLSKANGGNGSSNPFLTAGANVTISGSWPFYTISATGSGGGVPYPGTGVPCSTGASWCTSYVVGSGANDLLQLDSLGRLPAVSGVNLTAFPATITAALNGNAATATNFLAAVAVPNGTSATTQTAGDNSTKLATDAFVQAALSTISTGVTSFNTRTGPITLVAGDIPSTINANTTGTASNLTAAVTLPSGTQLPLYVKTSVTVNGHPLSANVTVNAADLGAGALPAGVTITGYVPTTVTVNGHALSSNVVVSASDLTTGTLPHSQLPTLLSADIPNNAANTSGNANTASALGVASVLPNGTTGTTQAPFNNSLDLATDAFVFGYFNQANIWNNHQTFCASASDACLLLAFTNQVPCCSVTPGMVYMLSAALSSNIPHIGYYDGSGYDVVITDADTVCDLNGGTGDCSSPAVLQKAPYIVTPNIDDAAGRSLSLDLATGDLFSLGPGDGKAVTGSVTSGAFIGPAGLTPGESVIQGTTGATGVIRIAPVGSTPMILTTAITGSPDSSHTWVGQTSGAVYTPTSTPATPFIQAAPAANVIGVGYGSDGRLQLSNGVASYSDVLVASDITPLIGPVIASTIQSQLAPTIGPASAYTNSLVNSASTVLIVPATNLAAGQKVTVDCVGSYNQTSAVGNAQFALTFSSAVQSLSYNAIVAINHANGVTSEAPVTTSGALVGGNATAAIGTLYFFEVKGFGQLNATTPGTISLQAATSAGTLNIAAGSVQCSVF